MFNYQGALNFVKSLFGFSTNVAMDLNQAIAFGELIQFAESMYKLGGTNPQPTNFPTGWNLLRNMNIETGGFIHQPEFIGFVAQSQQDPNQLAFVFHGTERILDIMSEIDVSMTPFTLIPNGGHTESGFTQLYKSLSFIDPKNGFAQTLNQYLNDLKSQHPGVSVTLAGHSLGGALASLHAAVLASMKISSSPLVYTFGAPMVGDQTFVNAYNALVSNSYRISNEPDIVPKLPGEFLGYRQTHYLFSINSLNYPETGYHVHSLDTYLYVLRALNGTL